MAIRLAYNPLDTPVVIDGAGRQIGGREHGLADSNSPEVKAALDGELLLWAEVPDEANGARPELVRLAERGADVEARRARLMRGRRADLHRLAEDRALSSEQTDGQLAAELALDSTVEVPEVDDDEDDNRNTPTDRPTTGRPQTPRTARGGRTQTEEG